MATWGKVTVKTNKYQDSPTLYYEYSTTLDAFVFVEKGTDDYLGTPYETTIRVSDDVGRTMMEAYICHIIAMDGLDTSSFVDRYINNNRYMARGA